jgi:hypothetical protein
MHLCDVLFKLLVVSFTEQHLTIGHVNNFLALADIPEDALHFSPQNRQSSGSIQQYQAVNGWIHAVEAPTEFSHAPLKEEAPVMAQRRPMREKLSATMEPMPAVRTATGMAAEG